MNSVEWFNTVNVDEQDVLKMTTDIDKVSAFIETKDVRRIAHYNGIVT